MIWLTWRQFRVSVAAAVAGLGLIAIVLAATHPDTSYLSRRHLLEFLSTFLVGLPALIGAFWGAPLLAGELETGTYRLAWTQTVTPTRWLLFKVTIIGAVSVAVTGTLTLILTAWSTVGDNQGRFGTAMFAQRGIAPMGYALFGFALGVTAGLVIKRVLPAMAATIVAFVAVRIVVQNWVRPHLATPLKMIQSLTAQNGGPLGAKPGDWVLSDDFVNSAGHVVNNINCNNSSSQSACLAAYHQVLTYQPASRYWMFQSYEVAIFAALSVILIGVCLLLVRKGTY